MDAARKPLKLKEQHLAGRKNRQKLREGPKKLSRDPGVPKGLEEFKDRMGGKLEKQKRQEEKQRENQSKRRAQVAQLKREQTNKSGVAAAILQGSATAAAAASAGTVTAGDKSSAESKELRTNERDVSKRHWYFRELRKVIEAADVILEVLDARDPLGCRCTDAEKMIQQSKPNPDGTPSKRLILILNKIDLVPPEVVAQWVKYLRREYPTIAFKASTQQQRSNIGHSKQKAPGVSMKPVIPATGTAAAAAGPNAAAAAAAAAAPVAQLDRNTCVGGGALLQLLKNYSRSLDLKKIISVGIVGYPNVGKSSLVNSLKRSRAVGVSSTPGFTKSIQQVKLDAHINLLDSPGVMFSDETSDGELVLRNCLKIEHISDPVTVAYTIVSKCTIQQLCAVYSIDTFRTGDEFLMAVAKKRGKLGPKGVPNLVDTARTVIQDWNDNRISFYSKPPEMAADQVQINSAHEAITVVPGWSKQFNFDQLLANVKDDDDDDGFDGTAETDPATAAGGGGMAAAAAAAGSIFASAAQKTAAAAAAKTEKKFALVSTEGTAAAAAGRGASTMADGADPSIVSKQVLADLAAMAERQQAARALAAATSASGAAGAAFGAVPFAYAPPTATTAAAMANGLGVGATSVPSRSGVLLPAHAFKPEGTMHGHATGATGAAAAAIVAASSMQEADNKQLLHHDHKRSNKQNVGAATPVSVILAEQGVVQRNKLAKLQQKKNKRDKKKFGGMMAGGDDDDDDELPLNRSAGANILGGAGMTFGTAAAPNGSRTIQQAAGMNDN